MQPTIVLVHGAFAESASWHSVIDPLRSAGHPVLAAANPLRGLAADARAVSDLVRSIEGPVVLVAHSYGGAVISNVDPDAGEITGACVKPLRIVDDTQQRLLLSGIGKQAEHGEPDQEPIRRSAGAQTKRRTQSIALRARELPQTPEHRQTQRMQAGECELHLGLNARRPSNMASLRRHRKPLQQSGLADPRLTTQHQHPALAGAHPRDQPIQYLALMDAIK
jgi:pimeloyl-ACP methyl ester carboxylesterase